MGCGCGGRSKAGRRVAEIRRAAERAKAASRQTASKKIAQGTPPPPQAKPPQQRRVVRGRVISPVNAKPYIVKAGDTMAAIAQRNGMSLKELLKFDGSTGLANLARLRSRNANIVKPGEMILIPSAKKEG